MKQAETYILDSLNKIKYGETTKTWDVSNDITINWKGVLPLPPANNSETTRKELHYVHELTENRTAEQIDLIKLVDEEPLDLYYKILKRHGLKMPQDIFDKAYKLVYPVVMNLKWKYNRPRPEQLAEKYGIELKVIHTKSAKTPSYPSGHTCYGALGAYVLASAYPEYSGEFFGVVSDVGMARMLQGVHYPSDNEASMVITGALWEDIRYRLFPELENF